MKMTSRILLPLLLALPFAPCSAEIDSQNQYSGPATSDQEMLSAIDMDQPGLEHVKAAVQAGEMEEAKRAYLEYRRHASVAKWRIMPADQPANAVAADDPKGNLIAAHQLTPISNADALPKLVDMGKDFQWTYNPLAPKDPRYTDEWTYCTVSRTQFWELLADAYWKTRNEKYAQAWVDQLMDFAAKNPVPPGKKDLFYNPLGTKPLLWRALDAAIRMNESWPYAYAHFLNSPAFTPQAEWTYLKLVYEHGIRLRAGLEDTTRTGNWVTAEAYALYTVGVLFPELHDAADWRQFAMDRLNMELERMVPPDGFEAELTPGYALVTIGEFQGPLKLAQLNHLPISDQFRARILSMYRALVLVMAQNGDDVPTNDSWPINAAKEARNGLNIGDDPLLLWAASGGKDGTPPPDSTMLPNAGFYAMRGGWKPDDFYLFFRGGPSGIGHQHEDMLEVVLRAWNKTLLLDPGSYSYDHSEQRRYILGTTAHNTITVDGNWQHRGTSKPSTQQVTNPWITTPLFDYVAATYKNGYQKNIYSPQEFYPIKWVGDLDTSITHTRRVLYLRPYYALVLDTLDGTGTHTYDAHFHLDAPTAVIDPVTQAAFTERTDKVNLALYPLERDGLIADVIQGQKEPMLGWIPNQHRPIPTVRYRKQQQAPATFATLLYPYKDEIGSKPQVTAKALPVNGDGFWAKSLDTDREKAEIVIAKNGKPADLSYRSAMLGTVKADAAGVIVREPIHASGAVFFGGWELRFYNDDKIRISLDTQATILLLESSHDSPIFFNATDKSIALSITRPFKKKTILPPGAWTEVSRNGSHMVTAPSALAALQGTNQ